MNNSEIIKEAKEYAIKENLIDKDTLELAEGVIDKILTKTIELTKDRIEKQIVGAVEKQYENGN